jgi:hypothetical protein
LGIPFKTIHKLTKIDPWFLTQIEELIQVEKRIGNFKIDTISRELLMEAKQKGYADRQIAHVLDCLVLLPRRKWRELLFIGALVARGELYVRDPSRPMPSFRDPDLIPEGVLFRVHPADNDQVRLEPID